MNRFGNLFSPTAPVGMRGSNDRADVAKVETGLGRLGYMDLARTDGPTGYFGSRHDQAIKRFQKDTGLKTDGHLSPGGPTLRKMAEVTEGVGGSAGGTTPPTCPGAKPPNDGDDPQIPPPPPGVTQDLDNPRRGREDRNGDRWQYFPSGGVFGPPARWEWLGKPDGGMRGRRW